MWTALHKDVEHDAATDLLLEEACRIADRLERLDALLRGDADEWVRVELPSDQLASELVLKVNPLLAEARQQAATLQRLVASLQSKPQPAAKGDDVLDKLARRHAAGPAAAEGQ